MLYKQMRRMRVVADHRTGSVTVSDLRGRRHEVAAFVKEVTR